MAGAHLSSKRSPQLGKFSGYGGRGSAWPGHALQSWLTVADPLLDDASAGVQHCCMPLWGKQKQKLSPAQWFIDPTDPKRWRWWDGRGWTDKYAPIESTDTVPAVRSTA